MIDERRLAEIKERTEKATKLVPLTADPKEPEYTESCPLCGNSNPELLMSSFDGTRASGVQVFGIGDDLKELEDFVQHSFVDIPWLLEQLENAQKEIARLKGDTR